MTYTDGDTKVSVDWLPLAMANGIEWSVQRKGYADRFDNLYRHGLINKVLWFIGALSAVFHTPKWCKVAKWYGHTGKRSDSGRG